MIVAQATALALSLFIGTANCHAQTNHDDFVWAGSASGLWQNAANWSSNGVTGVAWPGENGPATDNAWFTNAGTFNVSLNALIQFGSNMFANASNTTATVTINAGSYEFDSAIPDNNVAIDIGEIQGATSIVYFVTTGAGEITTGAGAVVIGKNGYGMLVLTNTQVVLLGQTAISLGGAPTATGVLIVSGTNTYVNNSGNGHLNVGENGGNGGCTVIISNSASLSTENLRLGGDSDGSTSNNTMIVTGPGSVFALSGGNGVVGKRSSPSGPPSYNNTLIFENGGSGFASLGPKNHDFSVGWADNDVDSNPGTTGNVLIVNSGCAFTNISVLYVDSNNFAYVYGGVLGGGYTGTASGTISNIGAVAGWGTLVGTVLNYDTNASLTASNSVGGLSITHDFWMSNSTLNVTIGTTYNPITVASNVAFIGNGGTVNIAAGTGFGNGTYTLISYGSSLNPTDNAPSTLTVGTTPNPSGTYTINTNTLGLVQLIISGIAPALPFKITSVVRTNSGNDMFIAWNTTGLTNTVQVGTGTVPGGSYTTNSFVNLTNIVVTTTTTNFTDVGGATNKPARYYRIQSP